MDMSDSSSSLFVMPFHYICRAGDCKGTADTSDSTEQQKDNPSHRPGGRKKGQKDLNSGQKTPGCFSAAWKILRNYFLPNFFSLCADTDIISIEYLEMPMIQGFSPILRCNEN